jgi:hypothetical protein
MDRVFLVRAEITFCPFGSIDALPPEALALFGGDAFSTAGWYRSVAEAGLPSGARPAVLVATQAGRCVAVFPMRDGAGGLGSLTTPYSCLWHPLFAPDLDSDTLRGLGETFGRFCRRRGVTRLEAIDADAPWVAPLLAGVRSAGLIPLWFAHFGNWFCPTLGLDWSAYLRQRPGRLRETVRRRTRRLMAEAEFALIDGVRDLDAALADYASVYARSWKAPEPFPAFNPALMRACAGEGTLRLGLLRRAGTPIAAQFWIVRDSWAGVQKLAHDEADHASAPGTVLTGLMIRHLLDEEHVAELDFGRGDDAYKQDWTGTRRQRQGVLLANPRRPAGFVAMARHMAGRLRRRG